MIREPKTVQIEPQAKRFSVEDYERLIELGYLTPDDKVELINGVIYNVAPMGSKHAHAMTVFGEELISSLKGKAVINSQCPIRLLPTSEPEPDFAVLKLPRSAYSGKLPKAEDVHFLVEVSNSTLYTDRSTKLQLYAQHNVPEVWIVNLVDNQVEIYRDPKAGIYTSKTIKLADELVSPSAFPDTQIDWSL